MSLGNIKKFSGELFIIACAGLWGMISLFSLPLNDLGFSSVEITCIRSLFATVFLGIYAFFKDRKLFHVALKDLPFLAFIGIGCFLTVCIFYTLSIEENGSSVAAMLMYTSPVWTVFISRFVFKEKITLVKLIALVGVPGGCAMLSFGGELHITVKGLFIGLATGLFLALYGICGKIAGRKYSAETVTFYVFMFSTLAGFFISSAWRLPVKIAANPICLAYFAGLAGLSTAIAYLFYSAGLKTISAGKASMISTLEIIVATIIGTTVFGITIGILGYFGIATTILSLILLEIGDLKHLKNEDLKNNVTVNETEQTNST